LVAALHATGGGLREVSSLGQKTRKQERQLREAIRLLDEQDESLAFQEASLATPTRLLANLEAVLGLALARAREQICTDPSKADYDSQQAQALEQLEKFHTDLRQITSA
jgi:hypothetical protein